MGKERQQLANALLAATLLGGCASSVAQQPEVEVPSKGTEDLPENFLTPTKRVEVEPVAEETEEAVVPTVEKEVDKIPTPFPIGGPELPEVVEAVAEILPQNLAAILRDYGQKLGTPEEIDLPPEVRLAWNAIVGFNAEAGLRPDLVSRTDLEMKLAIFADSEGKESYGVVFGAFPENGEAYTPAAWGFTESEGDPTDNTEFGLATSASNFPGALIGPEGGLPDFAGLVGLVISPDGEVLGTTWQTELGSLTIGIGEEVPFTVKEEVTTQSPVVVRKVRKVALVDKVTGGPGKFKAVANLGISPEAESFLPEGDVKDFLGSDYGSLELEEAGALDDEVKVTLRAEVVNLREAGPETKVLAVLTQGSHEITALAISPDGQNIKVVVTNSETGEQTNGWVAVADGNIHLLRVDNWHNLLVEETVPPTPEPVPTEETRVESRYRQVENGSHVYITESGAELTIPQVPNTSQALGKVNGRETVLYIAENTEDEVVAIAFPETYIADRDSSGAEIRNQICAVGMTAELVRPQIQIASVEELKIPLFVDPTTATGENPQLVLQFSEGQNTGRTNMFVSAPKGSTLAVSFEMEEGGSVLVSRGKQSWGGSTMSIGNEMGIFPDSAGWGFDFYVWSADGTSMREKLQLGDGFSVVRASSFTGKLLEGYQRIFEPDPVGKPNFSIYLKSLLEDSQGQFPANSFTHENLLALEDGSFIFILANNADRQIELS